MIRLDLHVDVSCMPLFSALFEKGVVLSASTGCTLRVFLCGQLGIADDYLDQRVQTLFLDARPVDDVDKAVIRDGATLALSAAMPGLLGATMRKGGRYAAFRKDISQHNDACGICETPGKVTVKLFNMVARELGPGLLEAGIEVDGRDIQRIVDRYTGEPGDIFRKARVDGQEITPDRTLFSNLSGNRVFLSACIAG
jgi:hypothetical protein